MTRQEAAKLLAAMAVTYSKEVTDDLLELWFNAVFQNITPEMGAKTVEKLIASDKFWPTPARFGEVRRSVVAAEAPLIQIGPKTQAEKENVERFIALCRQALADRDKRPHWHGGPEKCWCGGINPNWKRDRTVRARKS